MRLLYLMHIPWGWAKQRPHFLAEELSKSYDVEVYCLKSYKRRNLRSERTNRLKVQTIFILPFGSKFSLVNWFNDFLIKIQVIRIFRRFDMVWLTSPIFGHLNLKAGIEIVYDCMDDFLEFPDIKPKKWLTAIFSDKEHRLVKTATALIFTSNTLKERVLKRSNLTKPTPTIVVNNAIKEIRFPEFKELSYDKKKGKINLVYIGTVSSWLDLNLIVDHINSDESVIYNLYGPSEIEIPNLERFYYHGPISHSEVFEKMDTADVLVMPFIVTSLIESVNPVKLYEYISTGKAIIASKYGESELFVDFVYLYSSKDEYLNTLNAIKSNQFNGKAKIQDCWNFVHQNTWTNRGLALKNFLNH